MLHSLQCLLKKLGKVFVWQLQKLKISQGYSLKQCVGKSRPVLSYTVLGRFHPPSSYGLITPYTYLSMCTPIIYRSVPKSHHTHLQSYSNNMQSTQYKELLVVSLVNYAKIWYVYCSIRFWLILQKCAKNIKLKTIFFL